MMFLILVFFFLLFFSSILCLGLFLPKYVKLTYCFVFPWCSLDLGVLTSLWYLLDIFCIFYLLVRSNIFYSSLHFLIYIFPSLERVFFPSSCKSLLRVLRCIFIVDCNWVSSFYLFCFGFGFSSFVLITQLRFVLVFVFILFVFSSYVSLYYRHFSQTV